MKTNLSALTKRLLKSRIFLKNFICLMIIQSILFSIFSLVIFSQSRSILEKESTASSQYQLEGISQAVDNQLRDMRYIAATLDTNTMVNALFSYRNPESIYGNSFYSTIQEILKSYVNGFPYIDSIYLYSEYSDVILTATDKSSIPYFTDTNWLDMLDETEEAFQIFFRAKNNSFPFVLCVMKPLLVNGYHEAIVINLNLELLPQLEEIQSDPYQEIYLISAEEEILYRSRQRELTEPLSLFPELSHFVPQEEGFTRLVNQSSRPYTYSQIPSSRYPWYYVTVTYLLEYASQLSLTRALFVALFCSLFCAVFLLSFLLSMRSVKPIQNLLQLIQNPEETLSSELYSDADIGYLADQITSYIQKNQDLTQELSLRLNVLNLTKILALQSQINPHFLFNTLNMIHIQESEALGYDHQIPHLTLELSRLMRYAFESIDLVNLETELQFTKMYVDILKERYGDKLHVTYDIDEEVLSAKVPKLFIQPIIENAVFHGLAKKMAENSSLLITCRKEGNDCIAAVKDNGVGISEETLSRLREYLKTDSPLRKSIGIKNIATRMSLLYGEAFRMEIESTEGEGSTVTLRFPIMQ